MNSDKMSQPITLDEAEKLCVIHAMERNSGNKSKAAIELGVVRSTLDNMLRKHGISDLYRSHYNQKLIDEVMALKAKVAEQGVIIEKLQLLTANQNVIKVVNSGKVANFIKDYKLKFCEPESIEAKVVSVSKLYDTYYQWSKLNEVKPLSKTSFGIQLNKLGWPKAQVIRAGNKTIRVQYLTNNSLI